MKNILVPIDFNKGALNAYKYALDLASTLEGKVTLLYVLEDGQKAENLPLPLSKALEAGEETAILKALKLYGELVQEDMSIGIPSSYAFKSGHPVKTISAYAEAIDADLIIMSTWWAKGVGRMLAAWKGNTGTKVIEHTRRPVLLIPEKANFEGVEHIIYATNFREKKQRIPKELIQLSNTFNMEVSVVHIRSQGTLHSPIKFDLLNDMYILEKGNINIQFYTIDHEKVVEGLNTFIEKEGGDILALLVHEKFNIIDRLLGTDFPHKMAFQSKIPLLILHQDYDFALDNSEAVDRFLHNLKFKLRGKGRDFVPGF